ncbi:cytochrome P450 [Chelatococcus sp. SYSU_G07232]|uniref:Cytochrome P450 n=1 Tax=Chelatococcus albus TaxID=3047466 RepID=A0ABT7AD05_9HYPH|nr:cytochrome P450 [Chelatococcus sp. SYSU_G07232]MDJ1157257.1 cytochrome P450 [Chelatococcus sp. SYSU_G07232]
MHPTDAVAAVTHHDPYPYYAELVRHRPVHRDEGLGLWVAAGAGEVADVLAAEACRVRPLREPVPRHLAGSAAGDAFGQLVRMNDGAFHAAVKPALAGALATVRPAQVGAIARACAKHLVAAAGGCLTRAGIDNALVRLPVQVVGQLLGLPEAGSAETIAGVGAFVRCCAPGATTGDVGAGHAAAAALVDAFRRALAAQGEADGLLPHLARLAREAGTEAVAANALGLLFQAHDATAGLLGNALVALARRPDLRPSLRREPGLGKAFVREVLRHDPPVQNTRRFLAADATVAGVRMGAGEAVLVVLAAANRDPSVNSDPDRFDMGRRNARCFAMGDGRHACPGHRIAAMIAASAVAVLAEPVVGLDDLGEPAGYRPSVNVRIPVFSVARR